MGKKAAGNSAGAEQLKNDLKQKQPARFYILCGEEDYLRRYYYEALKKQLLDPLTADFNFHRLTEENFSAEALSDCLEALPMMAERSLTVVEDVDLFELSENERNRLIQMLDELPEYCCLVLTYEDFQPDKRKKKLWNALEHNAVIAEFRYQSPSDLMPWITRHFRAGGKQITSEQCAYLLARCGSSMTRLHGEIEKLCAYCAGQNVTRADIDAVVEPSLEAVSFEISDALGRRDFERAMERLHVMLKLRAEPILVLAAIGGQFRRLNAARALIAEKKGEKELMELCGIAPYPAEISMKLARRLSDRFCERAVVLCRDTDYRLKTSYDDPQRLLELLIASLAQEASYD